MKYLNNQVKSSGTHAICGLDSAEFLRDYWQKKPLLIRQAFPGFTPELDADDIAGLACDETAESRLVTGSYPEHDWNLRYGPFTETDFANLPQANWTLLVQDVEKHYPPVHSLLDEFSFLPSWRIDDLMVSVAGPDCSRCMRRSALVPAHLEPSDRSFHAARTAARFKVNS